MINSIKVLSGYASNLPCLRDRLFEFTPGINILYGPNGCGKSSLLQIMGAYCGIDSKSGGWSKVPKPLDFIGVDEKVFPRDLCNLAPGKCTAEVKWDGTASFINSSDADSAGKQSGHLFFDTDDSPDGITTVEDQLASLWGKMSQGQTRSYKLNKLFHLLKTPPKLTVNPHAKHNDVWSKTGQAFVDYIKSLNSTGRVSALIDEPEKSLSLDIQMLFWHLGLKFQAIKNQLIIASHSPFSLFVEDANIIDMEQGYATKSKEIVQCSIDPVNNRTKIAIFATELMNKAKVAPPKKEETKKQEAPEEKPVEQKPDGKARNRVRKPARRPTGHDRTASIEGE